MPAKNTSTTLYNVEKTIPMAAGTANPPTIAPRDVYVICHGEADAAILGVCNLTTSTGFDGNDGLCLAKGQLVATGQTCNTQAMKVGDSVKATFGALGTVEMVVH